MHKITSENATYYLLLLLLFILFFCMQKCCTQKATAGSLNKVPTNTNIHLAVKNNEICSPLGELPKAFKKKRNRYSIFQKLLSETGITAVQLPKDYFTSGRHHFTYFWAYLGDLWPVFVPEQRNAFSFSLLLSKTLSEVQWLWQWDSQAWALEGVLRYLWVQTEKEQICNLNGTVSLPPWIEFLQSWCKIRGHTQSPARWQLRCLWPKEYKVQWQLHDKGQFAIVTGRALMRHKCATSLDSRQRSFQPPFVNKKRRLLGRTKTNTSAYPCFLKLRFEQSLL